MDSLLNATYDNSDTKVEKVLSISDEEKQPGSTIGSTVAPDGRIISSQVGDQDGSRPSSDEPAIIETGMDVSLALVDPRDDEDNALTVRSLVIGTALAGLGAALCQIFVFKPVTVAVSPVFLLLVTYCAGVVWAKYLPAKSTVEGTILHGLGPLLDFINPGSFGLKEHVVASLMASTASKGNTAVMNFAVQRLYYNTEVDATTAVLATFSTACFGYGLVGLFRTVTVYPSEMVYWANLPSITIFQALHFDNNRNKDRLNLFWRAFSGIFFYEIIPAYIFPLLNGVNIFCLASQKASLKTKDVFTNLFGGTNSNEGLGFVSMSFDWQFVSSWYMSVPLIQQANAWVGYIICYIAIMAIYYSNTWNSLKFPMLSTSIFSSNGTVYNQESVFGSTFQLNRTALAEVGLPALTGSNAWSNLTANLAIGSMIAHVFLFWVIEAKKSPPTAQRKSVLDPHYQAMQKYNEAPSWWYLILLCLSFVAGLVVVGRGGTTLPWWSYIVALLLGTVVAPFSTILYGRTGSSITTTQITKMVAGWINPGKPVANLYFSMWSHDVINTSIVLAGDLKLGQYLKIPPRVMFLTQVLGTLIGALVNYVVMTTIVSAQRTILLEPRGTNIWSGQQIQSRNSGAITWSLAKELYGRNGPYFVIPLSLVLGMLTTFIQWCIYKRWPKIGRLRVDSILLPVIYFYSAWMSTGVTSPVLTTVIVGVLSQVWLRRCRPVWFKKYNYILGAGLDGGSQVMVFVLSFAVFGASGVSHRFPNWAGNPRKGNIDHCNGNRA